MEMEKAITALYPDLVPGVDFAVQNDYDERGWYLRFWDAPYPLPTQADLDRGWWLYSKGAKLTEIIKDYQEAIKALYPKELHDDNAYHLEIMHGIATNNTAQRTNLNNLVTKRKRAEANLAKVPTGDFAALADVNFEAA